LIINTFKLWKGELLIWPAFQYDLISYATPWLHNSTSLVFMQPFCCLFLDGSFSFLDRLLLLKLSTSHIIIASCEAKKTYCQRGLKVEMILVIFP